MIRRFKRAWIKALRSGRYKQTSETLCRVYNNKVQGYCCLGVLCEVVKKEGEPMQITKNNDAFNKKYVWNGHDNPDDIMAEGLAYQFRDRLNITSTQESHLISMNDDEGATFDQIADWIEKNL